MALVERRGFVNLDSDSEDLPAPLTRVKPKSEVQYVVISDSSDDDDDDDEDEEIEPAQITHAAWIKRLQARNSPLQRPSPAQYQSMEASFIRQPSQQYRLESSHPNSLPDTARVVWPTTHNGLNSPSSQVEIDDLLFTRNESKTSHTNNPIQNKETIHPRFTVDLPPADLDADEYVLSLFNDFYPEYNGTTGSPPQRYSEADEASVRANENHKDMVALHNFDEALGIVLEVLPDICTEFVHQKYDERRAKFTNVDADALLADILSEKTYPKQKPSKKRKRRDGEADEQEIETLNSVVSQYQIAAASKILQKQFNSMPANYIAGVLKLKKSVYDTIRTLAAVEKSPNTSQSQPFQPLRKKRRGTVELNNITDPDLKAQFEVAHKKIAKDEEAIVLQQRKAEEDAKATERAFELQDVSECQCCFDTYPNAKMVVCDAETPHSFCTECLAGHVKAQLDLQKHDIKCMDGSSCTAGFSRSSKQKALDTATFERWERLEQQNVLRESGLPLDHCPFCDFAAICPPVEEDRELRCQAPDCGVVSCRLCKQKSHVPLTCREYKREQGFEERHQIEEEMTKAFLRMCPKCKIPIFKEGGCNKITCTRCHSHICDVCGKDITKDGYRHFGRDCPQSDEFAGTKRTANRVKAAEQAAREEVLAANPDLTAADLEIKAIEDKNGKKLPSVANLADANLEAMNELRERGRQTARQVQALRRQQRAANMAAVAVARMDPLALEPGQQPAENIQPGRMDPVAPTPTHPHPANVVIPPAISTYNQFVFPGATQVTPQYLFHNYGPLPPVTPLLRNGANHTGQMPQPQQLPTYTPLHYYQPLPSPHLSGLPPQAHHFGPPHPYLSNVLDPFTSRMQYGQNINQITPQQVITEQIQGFPPLYSPSTTRNEANTTNGFERW